MKSKLHKRALLIQSPNIVPLFKNIASYGNLEMKNEIDKST